MYVKICDKQSKTPLTPNISRKCVRYRSRISATCSAKLRRLFRAMICADAQNILLHKQRKRHCRRLTIFRPLGALRPPTPPRINARCSPSAPTAGLLPPLAQAANAPCPPLRSLRRYPDHHPKPTAPRLPPLLQAANVA